MKNILIALLLMAVPVLAADKPKPEAEVKYYRSGEFSIDLAGSVATTDFDNERTSVGFGVNLFLTENIGVGASTALDDLSGSAFDNVSLRGIYRIPISKNAIYGYGGAKRLLNRGEWAGEIGLGAERRFTPNIGVFVEAGGEKELTGDRNVKAVGRTGFRISF